MPTLNCLNKWPNISHNKRRTFTTGMRCLFLHRHRHVNCDCDSCRELGMFRVCWWLLRHLSSLFCNWCHPGDDERMRTRIHMSLRFDRKLLIRNWMCPVPLDQEMVKWHVRRASLIPSEHTNWCNSLVMAFAIQFHWCSISFRRKWKEKRNALPSASFPVHHLVERLMRNEIITFSWAQKRELNLWFFTWKTYNGRRS